MTVKKIVSRLRKYMFTEFSQNKQAHQLASQAGWMALYREGNR